MPLFWLALAFAAGIALGSLLGFAWWGWLLIAAGAGGLPFFFARTRLSRVFSPLARSPGVLVPAPALLLAAACLGAGRYQLAHPPLTAGEIAYYNGRGQAEITALVASPPEGGQLRLQVRQIQPLGPDPADPQGNIPLGPARPIKGLLVATTLPGADYHYGDLLLLTGEPWAPPAGEDFSYREALARQGAYSFLGFPQIEVLATGQGSPILGSLYRLRERAVGVLGTLFPPPEAGLLAGILLGDEQGIPGDLQQAFKDTGTAHIIAISGFNITILAGLLAGLFTRLLGRWKGILITLIGIGLYTLLVGAGASVVRAAIMGALALFARQVGRRQVALNTLGATALVMCLVDPGYPGQPSFQLSFMATLGLVLYADPLQSAFERLLARRVSPGLAKQIAAPVGEYLLFTLAAQLTTLPVMAYHFGQVSLVSLLANPLILPPQPLVMVLGGLAVIGGLIWLPLGQLLATLAWPFVAYTIRGVEALASLPHATLSLGRLGLPGMLAAYALIFGLTLLPRPAAPGWKDWLKTWLPNVGMLALVAVAALTWRSLLARPDGRLHLTVLDGEGEALLLRAPGGGRVLVGVTDGAVLARWLPPFARGLDLVITPAKSAREGEAIQRLLSGYPSRVVLNLEPSPAPVVLAAYAQAEAEPRQAMVGQSVDLGGGGSLTVAALGKQGAGLELRWEGLRAWITSGDGGRAVGCDEPVSLLLLTREALKVGDLAAWQAACQPQATLLLGLTDPMGVLRDPASGLAVGTLSHGWVEVVSDGERLWVEAERK